MMRNVVIVLLIAVISLTIFKVFDKNAGAQDVSGLNQILENQKLILQKLDTIESKIDVLRTRIH